MVSGPVSWSIQGFDVLADGVVIERYRDHIEPADGLRDFATGKMPRERLEDLEEHAHVIVHSLENGQPSRRQSTEPVAQ